MAVMDDRAAGAAALFAAIDAAAHEFRKYGYARFLEHQSVRWERLYSTGFAEAPGASVGVSFDLNDGTDREVWLELVIRLRGEIFEVDGHAVADEPLDGVTNQRYQRELPQVRTNDIDQCVAAIAAHTAELCSYVTVLADLGVPRT
jgi:hypothetical protein